jgi:hypothetical protein
MLFTMKPRVIFFCAAAAAANYWMNLFVWEVLTLPLFLDTLFTIAAAFIFGPAVGTLTAVFSIILTCALHNQEWSSYLYIFCSIAGVFLACGFARAFSLFQPAPAPHEAVYAGRDIKIYTVLKNIAALFMLALAMCFVVSVLGGVTSMVITLVNPSRAYNPDPEIWFLLGILYQGIPLFVAEILARIPINIIDRIMSVFGAYGIAVLAAKVRQKITD